MNEKNIRPMHHPRYHAYKTPDKPAYIMASTGKIVTYAELEKRVNRCSQFFREMGLHTKDHMAILMENNAEYLEIVCAACVAGLIYTPISTHLTEEEIAYIVNDCDAKIFVTSSKMKDKVGNLKKRLPEVKTFVSVGGGIEGYLPYKETVEKYPETPIPEDIEGLDMLYSSGTTGRPKGILRTLPDAPFGELASMAIIKTYDLNSDTVYLSPAPLYHAAPLRWCVWTMRMGGTAIIMDKFDAEGALALIEKYRVNKSQWVPTMFIRMLKLPKEVREKHDISSLNTAVHSAAPCPVQVKEQMIAWWGPIISEYYAGTEGNTLISIDSEEWLTHKGSVGRAKVGIIHIMDDRENELPVGQPGNIYVENGFPFEYHNDPEKTESGRAEKGWTTMGDIGYLDEEDYLYLTDRKADMIISGGVNIYPQEAENLLIIHPKVLDAAVFGIPNAEFGEEVKAVIRPADMAEAGEGLEKELMEYCHQHLSKIKCPKSIDFRDELPRTPTGKLIKRFLKDEYIEKYKDEKLQTAGQNL